MKKPVLTQEQKKPVLTQEQKWIAAWAAVGVKR